jgi:hypothetical protein
VAIGARGFASSILSPSPSPFRRAKCYTATAAGCVCWEQLKDVCLDSFYGSGETDRYICYFALVEMGPILLWNVKFRPILNSYHELAGLGSRKRMDWTGRGFGLSKVGLGHERVRVVRPQPMSNGGMELAVSCTRQYCVFQVGMMRAILSHNSNFSPLVLFLLTGYYTACLCACVIIEER